MSSSLDSIQGFDPYLPALAAERFSMVEVAQIVGKTLQKNQEQQNIADSTHFEQNFRIVNLLL